jgi:ribonuclease BN (tRNA processing enzyme)
MKIKFIGSGGAFTLAEENFHSNVLIEVNGKRLLFDCGTTIGEALHHFHLTPKDVDAVFISHNHADHSGGMELLGFKRYFGSYPDVGTDRPKLFGHKRIIHDLWEHSLKAGMESVQGKRLTLDNYFDVQTHDDNGTFEFEGIEFRTIDTVHVVDDKGRTDSQGIIFTVDGTTVMISGDTQFRPELMMDYYLEADLIFHECEFLEYPNSVHPQFHELCTLPDDIKKKMCLYHYSLPEKTSLEQLDKVVKVGGFQGVVRRGQEWDIK